jgi:hypothetical protein
LRETNSIKVVNNTIITATAVINFKRCRAAGTHLRGWVALLTISFDMSQAVVLLG